MAMRQFWKRSKAWPARKQVAAGVGISIIVLAAIGAILPDGDKAATTVSGEASTTISAVATYPPTSTTSPASASSAATTAPPAPSAQNAPAAGMPAPASVSGRLIVVSGDENKVLGSAPTGPCIARTASNGQLLPDPACTPGVIAAHVTQDNIAATICVSGYTATVRPSTKITNLLKQSTAAAYGFSYQPKVQEYDHFVPLALGGANDTRNLWTEPPTTPTQKSTTNLKDAVEDKLHDLVCAGRVSLADAQNRIAADWTVALAGL